MTDHIVSTSVRLDQEWQRINHRPAVLRRVGAWGITPHPPSALDELLRVAGLGGNGSREQDRVLRRLVAIARTDDLAGRIVIERLKPGLLARGRRHRSRPDAFEELLAAAWIALRTFNPDRRASNIASALVSDAEWLAFRQHERKRASQEFAVEILDLTPAPNHRHPLVELAELIDEARAAGLPADDLDLVRRFADDQRTDDIASELDVSPRTVRNRRNRVTSKLREIALAA